MRVLAPIIFVFCFVSCDHKAPVQLAHEVDLRYGGNTTASQLRMQGIQLTDHASYDALEKTFSLWSQETALIEVYDDLLEGRPSDILLAVRACLLRLKLGGVAQVPSVIPIAELLKKEHPQNADVKFLLGESAFQLLPRGQGEDSFDLREYRGTEGRPSWIKAGVGNPVSVAQTSLRLWKELLALDPNYSGAQGMTAERVRARVKALESALQKEMALAKPSTAGENSAISPDILAVQMNVLEALQRGVGNKELCKIGKKIRDQDVFPLLAKKVRKACLTLEEEGL